MVTRLIPIEQALAEAEAQLRENPDMPGRNGVLEMIRKYKEDHSLKGVMVVEMERETT